MPTQTSRRRAVFVLVSGNPGGIGNWNRLVGHVERMGDAGTVRVVARLEEKGDSCLEFDFADDDFARKKYYKLKDERGTFMGKLEILSSLQDAELAMKQMGKRFPLVNYVFYEASIQSEDYEASIQSEE